ncbi:MAG: HAMP domain-containing histidine kinase [Chloroflexi bacterium]|nr:HAMP domain-containing histidine kinase [Chloroflexota bacterium]
MQTETSPESTNLMLMRNGTMQFAFSSTPIRLVLLASAQEAAWMEPLSRGLGCLMFPNEATLPLADVRDLVERLRPDVVIATYSAATPNGSYQQVFRTLSDGALANRPLLVYVVPTEEFARLTPSSDLPADLVLHSDPTILRAALQTTLQLRYQQRSTYRDCQAQFDEMQRLKSQLEAQKRSTDEVNLLKTAIVRNVSHEFRTPLLHMKSAVHLLAEEIPSNKLVEYAVNATARLEMIITNISLLAQSMEITLGPVFIRESIDQALRHLRRSWEHKDHLDRVRLEIPDELPLVLGDKQALGTVMQLLIENALKFSEGEVVVFAKPQAQEVIVGVQDTGIGIPKDQFDKIFEAFYQVDSSSTRRYSGTGVGLSIVRVILDRHQVTIKVESEAGQGSTFSFALPRVEIGPDLRDFPSYLPQA